MVEKQRWPWTECFDIPTGVQSTSTNPASPKINRILIWMHWESLKWHLCILRYTIYFEHKITWTTSTCLVSPTKDSQIYYLGSNLRLSYDKLQEGQYFKKP